MVQTRLQARTAAEAANEQKVLVVEVTIEDNVYKRYYSAHSTHEYKRGLLDYEQSRAGIEALAQLGIRNQSIRRYEM
jgi:hypothetical protein